MAVTVAIAKAMYLMEGGGITAFCRQSAAFITSVNNINGVVCNQQFCKRYQLCCCISCLKETLELHQLDVSTSFLQGDQEEEVYMQQPPGFVQGNVNTVCKLKRSFYGPQQHRGWYYKLESELATYGFRASSADAGLYIMGWKDDSATLLYEFTQIYEKNIETVEIIIY